MMMSKLIILAAFPVVAAQNPRLRTVDGKFSFTGDDIVLEQRSRPDVSLLGMDSQLDSAESGISALASQLSSAEDAITAVGSDAESSLSEAVTVLGGVDSTLSAAVASAGSRISSLESTDVSMQGIVGGIRDDVRTVNSSVNSVGAQLSSIANTMNALSAAVGALNNQTALGSRANPGETCYALKSQGVNTDGAYWVTGSLSGETDSHPFKVYCDMTTNGGGWTLVDNHPRGTACFTTRLRSTGPISNMSDNRGAYLPRYQWSNNPRMMVKSTVDSNGGNPNNWVEFRPSGYGFDYPTRTRTTGYHTGAWTLTNSNGNRNQGVGSWIYDRDRDGNARSGDCRMGSIWIGNGGQPTAACCYCGSNIGLGRYVSGSASAAQSCSSWVR